MRMTKQELAEHTIAEWQPRTPRRISEEDAREIAENLTGFFSILAEWSRKDADERVGIDKVLNAAALTYVAAVISTLLTLVYFLMRSGLLGSRN